MTEQAEIPEYAATPPFDGPGSLKYGLRLGNGWDYCTNCGKFRQYFVEETPKEESKNGIRFGYKELHAICCHCHEEMDVAEVWDWNVDRYWLALYETAFANGRNPYKTLTSYDIRKESVDFRGEVMEKAGEELSDSQKMYMNGINDFSKRLRETAEDGGGEMDTLDVNDIRRELLGFLTDDTVIWDVGEEDDRARANDALYKQGAIEFAWRLQEKLRLQEKFGSSDTAEA